jgi:branched-chain amino acid transport system substrate-binding protein
MFLEAYQKAYGRDADVFAVQGYDTGSLLLQAISATGGETGNGAGVTMIEALSSAEVPDSPRGPWRMSRAHNPVMDVYLRQVEGGVNRILGVASKDLADPATGCKMG